MEAFSRHPVSQLLEERVRFLDAQIQGLETSLEGAVQERDFALKALIEWRGLKGTPHRSSAPTVKEIVLELMKGSDKGWKQAELIEEGLRQFNRLIERKSLPTQMKRLSESGKIAKRDGMWWYSASAD